jgi:hypothetical protein
VLARRASPSHFFKRLLKRGLILENRDGIQLSRQQPDRKKRLDFQPVSQPALLTRRRIHIPADFAANASFKGFDEGGVSVSIHEIGALWGIL